MSGRPFAPARMKQLDYIDHENLTHQTFPLHFLHPQIKFK